MTAATAKALRCAIYTRVSTDAGLEQDFNSLDAQREAAEAFIQSQRQEGWTIIPASYDDGGYSGGTLDRPALTRLLSDVKARLVDIVVVYKVDRLTRSLADFAKLVETFDAHEVSFVSVTQAFNTTNSMGRLTLNVLLSFAQFEREVTGERIRDKIAASKKKGIFMGGTVPFGYRALDRKLVIDPNEAKTVRMIFQRYLDLGSVPLLLTDLYEKGIRTRVRETSAGRIGGIPYTGGPLAYLLKNRTYRGEAKHNGHWYPGEHEAIVPEDLFTAVQHRIAQQRQPRRATLEPCQALLGGKVFDDRGNVMSATYTGKGSRRFRYYFSRALVEGRKSEAGSVSRVSASQIEIPILAAVRSLPDCQDWDAIMIAAEIQRVTVEPAKLSLQMSDTFTQVTGKATLNVDWALRNSRAKRAILLPHTDVTKDQRPIRSERRQTLLRAMGKGRLWLKQLLNGEAKNLQEIAQREDRTERSIAMTISLAFVAPDIVEAAVKGALPRGIGLTRLMDLPPTWPEQRRVLGLAAL